jgi:ABC-2 type transport system permease protein
MTRILIVARWEFVATVTRASFVALAIGLPLMHLGIAALMGLSMQAGSRAESASRAILVVDPAGTVVEAAFGGAVSRNENEALRALHEGRADAVVVLDSTYRKTGRVRMYSSGRRGLFRFLDAQQRRERAEAAIRSALVRLSVPEPQRARIVSPIVHVEAFHVDARRRAVADSGSALVVLGGAFGVSMLLSLAIFMSSGLLQQAMAAERENRMLELLLVSVRPLELLSGKMCALAAAGLLQMAVYLVLVLGAAPGLLGLYDISVSTIAWSAATFTVGYALFAAVMAATGTLGRDVQASTQIGTLWVLAGAAPMFLITFISAEPHSSVARILTWIPLTSPVALLLRLGIGDVPPGELLGPLALALATAAALLVASSALLRRIAVGQPAIGRRTL